MMRVSIGVVVADRDYYGFASRETMEIEVIKSMRVRGDGEDVTLNTIVRFRAKVTPHFRIADVWAFGALDGSAPDIYTTVDALPCRVSARVINDLLSYLKDPAVRS